MIGDWLLSGLGVGYTDDMEIPFIFLFPTGGRYGMSSGNSSSTKCTPTLLTFFCLFDIDYQLGISVTGEEVLKEDVRTRG